MHDEPDLYDGKLDDFGTDLTSHFIHDAVKRYDYAWDPKALEQLSRVSMFMVTAQHAANQEPEYRTGHEHVLVKILTQITAMKTGAGK